MATGMFVGLIAGRWALGAPPPTPHDDVDSTAALVAEIDDLRDDIRSLGEQRPVVGLSGADAGQPASPASAAIAAGAEPGSVPRYTAEELQAMSEADGAARRIAVEAALSAGSTAPWQEQRVLGMLEAFEPPAGDEAPRVLAARCTVAICRIQVAHRDPIAARQMFIRLSGQPGLNGAGLMLREDGDDGYITTFYVSQNEERLPRPEPL